MAWVAPVAIAGAMAVSAIAQWYQSQSAAHASKERLDEIKAMFDAIKPPNYDVKITDPPKYIEEKIPEAEVDYSKLTPEQYKLVGQYKPEIASYVAEKAPQVVTKSEAAQTGRSAQLDALKSMRQRATSSEMDPIQQTLMDQASRKGQIEAQSRQASIMQDAQRHGTAGSGFQLAAQLQGGSDSMQRAADADQQAAVAAYQAKLGALRDSASLGGQVANDELNESARNADIINSFNQRTAKNANQYGQYRAGELNDAQRMNLDAAQSIANRNTTQTNDYAKSNRNMANQGSLDAYGRALNERNYQNQTADKNYNNQLNQQDRYNKMQSQIYGDQMFKAQGASGQADKYNAFDYQRAQDNNKAFQGGANAIANGVGAYGNSQAQNKSEASADDQAFMKSNGRWMTDDERENRRRQRDEF